MTTSIFLVAALTLSAPAPTPRPKPVIPPTWGVYDWGAWRVILAPGGGLLMRYPRCVHMGVTVDEAFRVGNWEDVGGVTLIKYFEPPHGRWQTAHVRPEGGKLRDASATAK